jgi:hypothetical protein
MAMRMVLAEEQSLAAAAKEQAAREIRCILFGFALGAVVCGIIFLLCFSLR